MKLRETKKELWAFPLYLKNPDGSESRAEVLGPKTAVRWYRSAMAIEASKKLKVDEKETGNQ